MRTGGWFLDSYRHSLAARGVKTGRTYNYKKVSLQPRFAQGLQAAWDDAREKLDSGDYIFRSKAAKMRERAEKRVARLKEQEAQFRFANELRNAPLSAAEEDRKKFLEARSRVSTRARASILQAEENELLESQLDDLIGVDGVNLAFATEAVDSGDLNPGVRSFANRAREFVNLASTRTSIGGFANMNSAELNALKKFLSEFEEQDLLSKRMGVAGTDEPLTSRASSGSIVVKDAVTGKVRSKSYEGPRFVRGADVDVKSPFAQQEKKVMMESVPLGTYVKDELRSTVMTSPVSVRVERPVFVPRKGWGGLNG